MLVSLDQSSLLLGMCLLASGAYANPTVSGNTISWPDDGWYQVQTADGSETVCSGGRSCDVSAGHYLVINHSTGQRFRDISVSESSTPAPSGVTVSGSTISWPDDGWYQVQTADGSRSVCEGGTSCDVESGRYLIINHSTGQRFPDIEVSAGSTPVTPPAIDTVTVTDDVISWPDNGWYQVQTSDGASSVCEGGNSCSVPAGDYVVINHSTGERFDNVIVGDSISMTPPTDPVTPMEPVTPRTSVDSVTVNGTTITWPDDGWYQIQHSETFVTACEGGLSCDVPPGSYFVINHSTGTRQTVNVPGSVGGTPPDETTPVQVNFNITVPVIVSNALQVQVQWAETHLNAAWLIDESWRVTGELAANTEQPLTITFYDDNGEITLASLDTTFRTSSAAVQEYQVVADQFDTDRWDSDGDGVSNLSESIAGTNPLVSEALEPVHVSLEFVQHKTFRISWQQSERAQYYRVFENPDGVSGFTAISEELNAAVTEFDHRVALYARVNAQYLVQTCNDRGCVDSEPVMVTGTLSSAIGYFKASNTGMFDNFGGAISLSSDGNTLAVGASVEDSTATGINGDQNNDLVGQSGAVYVFVRSAGLWQQQAYVKANNTGNGDQFGEAVSLSADGNTLAVGAPGDDSAATGINGEQHGNAAGGSGAVHVFVRSDRNWQQQAYIKASNTARNQFFGSVVSLSANGNTLAVGAEGENSAVTGINGIQNDFSAREAGAVYVFLRNDSLWQQQAYIKASNTGEFDRFGIAVSLSADGNTLAVGADAEDSASIGINGDQNDNSALGSGAVYVYVRTGELWQQQAYIKASSIERNNLFGRAVSLSADGSTLVVSAYLDDSAATGINGNQNDNSANDSGAVYVFVRSGELWQQQAYIKASNTEEDDSFGIAVSLSADGDTLAVGTTREDSAATGINGNQNDNSADESGAVYLFVRSGELWQQQAYIKASNTGFEDSFGGAVSLSADGNTLAAGAIDEDSAATGINGAQNDSVSASGAVYLY